VYKNPNFNPESAKKKQRPTISLKKDQNKANNSNSVNQSIWQSDKD